MESGNGMPPQGGDEGKAAAAASAGSIGGYESLHRLLESNLSPQLFKEASRLLLGLNCARPLEAIPLPEATTALAEAHNFDVQTKQREMVVGNEDVACNGLGLHVASASYVYMHEE